VKRKRSQSDLEPFASNVSEFGRLLFLAQSPPEIARSLCAAVCRTMGVRRCAVYLREPKLGTFAPAVPESDPGLVPEKEVVEFALRANHPPVLPHHGVFLAVFPLRAQETIVGILSVDLTGIAEEFPKMNLDLVTALLDQGAAALWSAETVRRARQESLLMRNILESITNGIVTIDNAGRVTRLNRNAMAMLELSPECVGRAASEVLPRDIVCALEEMRQETSEVGTALERILMHKASQGSELPLAVSTSLLSDEHYHPLGMIVIFRDMTATRELDRLRRLDQMKSQFLANVSHELKTPLTSIKAYTEALTDSAQDSQTREFLRVIQEESDRLLALINNLLHVSQIHSGRLKMNLQICDPRACILDILGISKLQSDRHQIVTEFSPHIPRLALDIERMKEVMANLLSNAIKYSPSGGTVWVRMRPEEKNLRIEVQDQGIGIPPEHLPNLFQPFYRVDSSTTSEIPGTGLGLVIAEAIVSDHGGRIWVDSEPGKGSTFSILLPMRETRNE